MKHLHEATYYGRDALNTYIKPWLTGLGISEVIWKTIARCIVSQKNNPRQKKKGKQYPGQCLFEDWQTDLTQMLRVQGWKCLLVFVDTFSGWVEAYPSTTEKSSDVVSYYRKSFLPSVYMAAFRAIMDLLLFQKSHRNLVSF